MSRVSGRDAVLALALLGAALPLRAEDLLGVDEQVARIDVCFDFGCSSRKRVYVFETEWREVADTLRGAASPADERWRLAHAVGAMERLVGAVTPTDADRGSNGYDGDDPSGQMDCIDESTNTTTYLQLFRGQGLLRFHRVLAPAYRAPGILDQHYAAQLEETATGRRFVVDSWYWDNGEPAVVQTLEHWQQERPPLREPARPPARPMTGAASVRTVALDTAGAPATR